VGVALFFVFVHSTVYIEEEKYATNCFMIISAPPPPYARALIYLIVFSWGRTQTKRVRPAAMLFVERIK
jgi:hypothetical protein